MGDQESRNSPELCSRGVPMIARLRQIEAALRSPGSAEVGERAAIVAWLRSRRMSFGRPTRNAQAALSIAAEGIEAGKHLTALKEPTDNG